MSHPTPALAVFCASSLGNHKAFQAAALSLGNALVDTEISLVYGCGSEGIMGIISGVVLQRGGRVTGVVPEAMIAAGGEVAQADGSIQEEAVRRALNAQGRDHIQIVKVDTMHERKLEMARLASGFIALPGGIGTIEEVMDAMTLAQVGWHNKPIVLLNVLSYFNPLREMIQNGIRDGFIDPQNDNLVRFIDGPDDHIQHELYDWGRAALEAIDSWERVTVRSAQYDWESVWNGEKNRE